MSQTTPDWRNYILQHFQESVHRLTLVADPDGLLLEEALLATIRERGFEVLPFEEGVAFRYAYESSYRRHWDDGQSSNLVVILRSPESTLSSLPYDLQQRGRRLHFHLPELFPRLSYPVIRTLEPGHYQPLYQAYQGYQGPDLGDQATKRFILKHVFGLDPDLIKTPLDLLKHLLSRHTRGQALPAILDNFLETQLRRHPALAGSPLLEHLASAEDFFAFLQNQWLNFLAAQQPLDKPAIGEDRSEYTVESPLPLAEAEVRGYLHTLFLDGRLKPVALPEGWQVTEDWTRIGTVQQPALEETVRFEELLHHLRQTLPPADAPHKAWLRFADRWAELVVLRHRHADHLAESLQNEFTQVHHLVESRFADWVLARYHTLHNQPFHSGPVMGHHVPHYLATYRRQKQDSVRIALVVIDGLALDQWLIIRQAWADAALPWRIEESGLFAWVPTLTSIARQAIFAGRPPQLFPESWQTTNKEGQRWQKFWQEQGLPTPAVGYARNLGAGLVQPHPSAAATNGIESSIEPDTLALIENPRLQVVGLVVNTIDNIAHGMQLGTAGMHQQVNLWLTQNRYLTHLVGKLLAEKFSVFLTADHGNVWARGIGRPNEGTLVETRGQRARIYTEATFLELARQQMPEAIAWTDVGLPVGLHLLLAPNLAAFLNVGDQAVCHGGIALEEVIVPFVQIETKETE